MTGRFLNHDKGGWQPKAARPVAEAAFCFCGLALLTARSDWGRLTRGHIESPVPTAGQDESHPSRSRRPTGFDNMTNGVRGSGGIRQGPRDV